MSAVKAEISPEVELLLFRDMVTEIRNISLKIAIQLVQ